MAAREQEAKQELVLELSFRGDRKRSPEEVAEMVRVPPHRCAHNAKTNISTERECSTGFPRARMLSRYRHPQSWMPDVDGVGGGR